MTLRTLILRYALFAVLAIAANLAAQRIVLAEDASRVGFALAVLCGTAVGLIAKYALDKRWIFFDFSTGLESHRRKFSLYTCMGVITTMIFWSSETAFWLIW